MPSGKPPAVPARLSLVTLGVVDVAASTAFYERLGWRRSAASQDTITFLDLQGSVLGLYGRDALAEDVGVTPPAHGSAVGEGPSVGASGVTLALNCDDRAEADAVYAAFVAAGAISVKPLATAFWGGYSGYVADLDGHLWEICHNPFAPNDAQGRMTLPEAGEPPTGQPGTG